MNSVFRYKRVAIDFDGTLFEDEYRIDDTYKHKIKTKG